MIAGAVGGALAVALLPQMLRLALGPFAAASAAPPLAEVLQTAFGTGWGAIGALIGGSMAWTHLRKRGASRARLEAGDSHDPSGEESAPAGDVWTTPWGLPNPGEAMLARGLVLLWCVAILLPQVMIGLLGWAALPIPVALLLIGTLRARDGEPLTVRHVAGLLLLLAGVAGILCSASIATVDGAEAALWAGRDIPSGGPRPPGTAFPPLVQILGWLAPVLTAGGLRLRGGWPPGRCVAWAVVLVLHPLVLRLFFHAFGQDLPLTA